jgi:hypothetical protein
MDGLREESARVLKDPLAVVASTATIVPIVALDVTTASGVGGLAALTARTVPERRTTAHANSNCNVSSHKLTRAEYQQLVVKQNVGPE